jgi:diguanylate cyclase (GGDEF)-like protein
VLVLQSPWLLVLCVALAFLAASAFTVLAPRLAARRGLPPLPQLAAGGAGIGTVLWVLPLALHDGRPAAAAVPLEHDALAWLAAAAAAALALHLGSRGPLPSRMAAVLLVLAGTLAGPMSLLVQGLATAARAPGPGTLAALMLAATATLLTGLAAALVLPGRAPEPGPAARPGADRLDALLPRAGAATGLLTAALLSAHAALPAPMPAPVPGGTSWTFPASVGLEAALLVGLLVAVGALAAYAGWCSHIARKPPLPAAPASGTGLAALPVPPLPLPPVPGAARRVRTRLHRLVEDLRNCEHDSDGWRAVSQAGEDLFRRWDGALSLACRPHSEVVVARWGRLAGAVPAGREPVPPHGQGAVPSHNQGAVPSHGQGPSPLHGQGPPLLSDRRGAPAWAGGEPLVLAPAAEARAVRPAVIRTQIAWAPGRFGTLHLVAHRPVSRSEMRSVFSTAEAFGESLRCALGDLHARREVRQPAIGDHAQGPFQRAVFEHALRHGCQRADRDGSPLVLGVVEIDAYESLALRFGTSAGEAVMRDVAACVHGRVRPCDIVCRVGVARLAVLMGRLPLKAARRRMELLRMEVHALQRRHLGVQLPSTTLSVGLAAHSREAGRDLRHRAEVALQAACRSGRNRVVCWDAWSDPRSYMRLDRAKG